jgi:Flp pilus assembly protein TadG
VWCQAARSRARDRGSVAVEAALVTPLLLLLVFGIFDYGWMMMKANVVNNAARDAARMASLGGSYNDITSSLDAELTSVGVDTSDVTTSITCTNPTGSNCGNSAASYDANATTGSIVIVTVTYTHHWISPLGAMCSLVADSCTGDTIVVERIAQMVRE